MRWSLLPEKLTVQFGLHKVTPKSQTQQLTSPKTAINSSFPIDMV
jgi:hypothetical protein